MPDALGTLFVCAVPIGNLQDASPRLLRVLAKVDAVACEDTRTTRRLLDLLEVEPIPRLLAHHEHNAGASAPGVVALLEQGLDVALVSDAGTPAVSDPGVELVAAAHDVGVEVVAIPGPSAVAAAVSVAGFGGNGYRFVGFLPRGPKDLQALLDAHAGDVLVAFNSPHRVMRTLELVAQAQPDRELAVCRELTKRYEQVVRGTAAQVMERMDAAVRGEVALVLGPLPQVLGGDLDPRALPLVMALVEEGVRVKVAARVVAQHLGGSARDLFDAANAARDSD